MYELFTGAARPFLDRYFESDILKTTLATDAVIGAMIGTRACILLHSGPVIPPLGDGSHGKTMLSIGPSQPGSAYILLHHVMGEAAGKKGVWSYVKGGMGSISEAIALSGMKHGVEICTNATVRRILREDGKAVGVQLADGSCLKADTVISGCTPYHTVCDTYSMEVAGRCCCIYDELADTRPCEYLMPSLLPGSTASCCPASQPAAPISRTRI